MGPPPLPNEHGAWAMLVIPILLGLVRARSPGLPAAFLAPAIAFLFLSRYAALPAAARLVKGKPAPPGFLKERLLWTSLYLGGSVACLGGAFLTTGAGSLRPTILLAVATVLLGTGQTLLALAGKGRTVPAELIGMAGLASAAPLLAVASGGPLDVGAFGAGALAMAYFLSSLSFVRAFRAGLRGEVLPAAPCIAAHAALGLLLGGLAWLEWFPATALLAFVPVYGRTAWGLRFPPASLRALGWREVAVAILFTTVAAGALLAD